MDAPPPAERDCFFDENGRWFRYRACAIILDAGRVLMARNPADGYFYSIGGGVHHGESAEDAVRREVREETGQDMAIERLAFVHENFFTDSETIGLAGRTCHELAFYFLMRYDPALPLVSQSTTMHGAREWHEWVPLDRYGVDRIAYPTFFATELADLGPTPKWITTRE